MRFLVICDDPAHMPWAIPVDGSQDDALQAAVEQYDSLRLVRPVMVIDYEESKLWRVGRDDDGWYLSDSAETKMGVMTQPEHIARDVSAMEASCES